jgi:hypothetical protein
MVTPPIIAGMKKIDFVKVLKRFREFSEMASASDVRITPVTSRML